MCHYSEGDTFLLNLERKATLRLHRLCLSIHVFHADWYTKKRGLFHINKVNKSKYSHNWNIDGQLYRRGFASADWSRYIDETSFFLKFLSTFNRYTSFPRVCWQNNFELNKESRNEANKYSFLKKKQRRKNVLFIFETLTGYYIKDTISYNGMICAHLRSFPYFQI